MKRVFLIVIDGFGVGELPDANLYGDSGSNTFLNLNKIVNLNIPTLTKLGLKNIDGLNLNCKGKPMGNYAKLEEISVGKDSITGHYEMMKIITKKPLPTFENGFPLEIVSKLEKKFGVEILGNCVASGTDIIEKLGEEHLKTKKPIVYTSADSVLQIATHTDIYPVEKLYEFCVQARKIMKGKYAVGRVIARPFNTIDGKFERISEARKDYPIKLKSDNTLLKLKNAGLQVFALGKINDIFASNGITDVMSSHTNLHTTESLFEVVKQKFSGLVFVNLVDTDTLYGHRNDVVGYAKCVEDIDKNLFKLIEKLSEKDVLIVTADHGNDPTTSSTDHSREYVPMLIYSKQFKSGINLGTIKGFDTIGKFVEIYFNLTKEKLNILEILWKN